jgi:hypothetical protein
LAPTCCCRSAPGRDVFSQRQEEHRAQVRSYKSKGGISCFHPGGIAMNVTIPRHLPLSLLLIRASVVLMLAPWIVD